jgi:hypothetical protein
MTCVFFFLALLHRYKFVPFGITALWVHLLLEQDRREAVLGITFALLAIV